MYDIVIIGSGPAGLSAAIYAQRENLKAVVVEKEFMGTGQIAESERVDNYPGLYGTTENFLRCFNISSLDELPPLPEGDEDKESEENGEEQEKTENGNEQIDLFADQPVDRQ